MTSSVFITVGSTSFNDLTSIVCSDDVLEVLSDKGYNEVVLQTGGESHKYINSIWTSHKKEKLSNTINIKWYAYKKDILEDIKASSLVISHAGAGSIMEVLKIGKPLIVVINEDLMENHQKELANALQKENYLKYCYCYNLADTIKELNLSELKSFPCSNHNRFLCYLDNVMGF